MQFKFARNDVKKIYVIFVIFDGCSGSSRKLLGIIYRIHKKGVTLPKLWVRAATLFIVSFLFTPSHYLFMLAHRRNESMIFCKFILPYSFNITDLPTCTLIPLIYPSRTYSHEGGRFHARDSQKNTERHHCRHNNIY